MKNIDAYKTEGFDEWLTAYTLNLDENLRNDIFVSSGGCKSHLKEYNVKGMKSEGMSDNDIIDYVRLHKGWIVGAYDGAFLSTRGPMLFDKDFKLDNNPTFLENLKALRFVLFMDQQYHKTKNIRVRKEFLR